MTGVFGRCALAALVAVAVTATASATGPAGNGRIALIDGEEPGGGVDVYTVNPDGSGRTRLTADGKSLGPAFSPDGSRIAFVKSHPPALDLYVMNADGTGGQRLLASHPEGQGGGAGIFAIAWSPDGAKIAYLLTRGGREDLHVVDAQEGTQLPLSQDAERKSSLAWFPAGTSVAYSAGDGPLSIAAAIMVKPIAGGPSRVLVDLPGDDFSPTWSPDGRWLAWTNQPRTSEPRAVWIAAADGSAARRVASAPAGFTGPAKWSPGGSLLLFDGLASSRPGPRNSPINVHGVWTVRPDGSNQTLLREHVTAPRWSPDGRRVMVTAYGAGEYGDYLKPGVYVMNADGSCLTLVTKGAGFDWQPRPGVAPAAPSHCVDLVLSADSVVVTGLQGASYALVVKNEGTQRATGVRLIQRFDSDVEIFVGRPSQGHCSASGGVVTCRSEVMEPGQALSVAVLARPRKAGLLTAQVSAFANERDADPAGDVASVRVRVRPCWIAGTDFPDTLHGTTAGEQICGFGGGDTIDGGGGADRIDGGWGPDTIVGGPGRDVLVGNRGDDVIVARDGFRDIIECGWGDDDRATVDRFDVVRLGCERISPPRAS